MENTSLMEDKKKQERTIVHLERNGKHYYYGNLKALCDNWSKDDIGLTYSVLRNMGITESKPFKNDKCIIRKGIIITSPRKMKDSVHNN